MGEAQEKSKSPAPLRTFLSNVLVIAICGLAFSFWLLRYTGAFKALGGLLGAGGALVWLAVVWGLIPKARAEAFQEWLGHWLFERASTWKYPAAVTGLAVLAANGLGTIEITAAKDSPPLRISVTESDSDTDPEWITLAPGEQVRLLKWVGCCRVKYRVESPGLPPVKIELQPWRRVSMTAPYSFLRPVLLLRASASFSSGKLDSDSDFQWRIEPPDGSPVEQPYTHYPVWVGVKTLELPPAIRDAWKSELAKENITKKQFEILNSPVHLTNELINLEPGTRLKITLTNLSESEKTDKRSATKTVVIHPVFDRDSMVRVVELNPDI